MSGRQQGPPPGPQSSNQPQILTLFKWDGINQSVSRKMMDDQELFWLENMFLTAEGQLRAGWGPSAPKYTAPAGTHILRIFFANVTGNNPSGFMFLDNWTVDRVDLNSGAVVHLGQIWTPLYPHYWADLKLWAPTEVGATTGQVGGVVIGSPAGLYAVDANDVVTGPGQTPPLWLTGGATTDSTGAALVMPSGLPGIYAMEVYQERLWVMGQTVISFSAPTNGADFSTGSGGGSFGYHGDKLVRTRTDLAAAGNFLYLFNDSSIDVVGNIQLIGTGTVFAPFTTAFQLANVDPQNGNRFYRPVGHWGNAFTLWNGAGLYGFQGQNAQLISQKIINLFLTIDNNPFEPTMCPADIHGRRYMLFLGTFTDPWQVKRPLILAWDGGIWVVASQNLNLTQIGSYEENSCIEAYGTDGTSLYQLFARADPALPKLISTKAYKGPNLITDKQWKRLYLEMKDNMHVPGPEGVSLTGTLSTEGAGRPHGQEEIGFDLAPGAFGTVPMPTVGAGLSAWVDLRSLSPDFVLERLSFTYDERLIFGA